MKRFTTLLFLFLLVSVSDSFAQSSKPKSFITIGPEVNLPIYSSHKTGYGGIVKLGIPVNANGAFTFTTGASYFSGKRIAYYDISARTLDQTIIPARLGFRYNVYKKLYLEPQVGYSRVRYEKYDGSRASTGGLFSNAITAGVVLKNRWDIAAKYEGNQNSTFQRSTVGLSFAYKFNFK